jgi:hypothetical protein
MSESNKGDSVTPKTDGRLEERIRSSRDSLPGRRNALPEGALGGLPPDPQGDENRKPPPNAPSIPQSRRPSRID